MLGVALKSLGEALFPGPIPLSFRRLTGARSEGLEPPTPGFEAQCSIQLSYERKLRQGEKGGRPTGVEPATSGVTVQRSNQLSYGRRYRTGV